MKRRSIFSAVLVITLAFFANLPSYGQSVPEKAAPYRGAPVRPSLATPAIEKRVNALLGQMTLEEKVGQLVQYSSGRLSGPGTVGSDYHDLVAKGQVGSLFNLEDAQATNQYQHLAVDKSRLHIPLLFGLDVIHGYRTIFPVPLGLASTWDPEVVEKAARSRWRWSSGIACAGVRVGGTLSFSVRLGDISLPL